MFLRTLAASFCFASAVIAAVSDNYSWKNVEIGGGGFVPGITFSKLQKDLIYARTDIGGCYRWDPATSRWIQLMNWVSPSDWGLSGIDSLIPDPVLPKRVYALAGTYTNSWDPNNGAVLRSEDTGNTWKKINLPFKVGGNMPGRGMGERLAVDPNNNNIVYLGARSGNGLWKSTDAGETWVKVASFPVTGTYVQDPTNDYAKDPIGIVWIQFDPKSSSGGRSQTIYVGAAEKTAPSIYVSKDGGSTWAAVPGQPTGFLPHRSILAPDGTIYITYSDGAGPYDGAKGDVMKYVPSTGIWTVISPVPSTSSDNTFGYGGLAIDWQNPKVLMVASLNLWWPDNVIWRSIDGGATWSRIWEWAGYPGRALKYNMSVASLPWLDFQDGAPPVPNVKVGWMIESMEIDPFNSNRFMYGTGMTIFGSNDLTKWDSGQVFSLVPMVHGQEETAVLDLISPPTGALLHSALGDISGFTHYDLSTPPKTALIKPVFTSGKSIDYAELNPSFIVRTGDHDTKHIAFSTDGGTSWFSASSEPSGTNGAGMIAVSANAKSVVWTPAGANGAFVSTDVGSSWATVTGLPTGSYVGADRVNPDKFYAFNGGNFYVSTDAGKTFKSVTALPAAASSSNRPVKAVPGVEGTVYVCLGTGGLHSSTNSGMSFTKVATVSSCGAFGFGVKGPGPYSVAIYLSGIIDGVNGLFRTDDGGATWIRINDDQHQYATTNYAIVGDMRTYGRVFVGTNGYGIVYGTKVTSTVSSKSVTTVATTKTTTITSLIASKTMTTTTASPTIITTSAPKSTSTTVNRTTTAAATSPTTCVNKLLQCGGSNYKGNKICCSGTTCQFKNSFYSQCV